MNSHEIEDVTSFKYLGNAIKITGGRIVKNRKARSPINVLGSIQRFTR